jgi:hypothetical protein
MATSKRTQGDGSMALALTVSGDGRGFLTVGGDAIGYGTTSARKDGEVMLLSVALPLKNVPASLMSVTPIYDTVTERWVTNSTTWTVVRRPKGTWSPPRRHEVAPAIENVKPRGNVKPAAGDRDVAALVAALSPADRKALKDMLMS